MNTLFCAQWKSSGRMAGQQEIDWLNPPSSGFGRLLLAVAFIGIAVSFLDQAAAGKGAADTLVAASYGSSR